MPTTTDTLDLSDDMPKYESTKDIPLNQLNQGNESVENVPQTDAALWTINEAL